MVERHRVLMAAESAPSIRGHLYTVTEDGQFSDRKNLAILHTQTVVWEPL